MHCRLAFAVVLCLLLASCAPSLEGVQLAMSQTQMAAPTGTLTLPTSTPIPTSTPWSKVPTKSASTATPAPNYIYELGYCVMSVGEVAGNPKDVPGCAVKERTQIYLEPFETMNSQATGFENVEIFCSLYDLDGTYIMTYLDTKGSGVVSCTPLQ